MFVTNQARVSYKLVSNVIAKQSPPKVLMNSERRTFKSSWESSSTKRDVKEGKVKVFEGFETKSAETIQQLVSRVRREVVMCD